MADSGQTLRSIEWRTAFPFTRLFRGFRLAIDPSKIVLALAMILLLYAGGRLLDAIWPDDHKAVVASDTTLPPAGPLTANARYEPPTEIHLYQGAGAARGNFANQRRETMTVMRQRTRDVLTALGKSPDGDVGDIKSALAERRDAQIKAARDAYEQTQEKTDAAAKQRDAAIRNAYTEYRHGVIAAEQLEPKGLFITFTEYEISQVDRLAQSIIDLNLRGAFNALYNFFVTAPKWAFSQHPVFFLIFGLYFLLLWSIFGGALARIAAVQEARDEKISIRQALRFSTGKVLSFFFAPAIPIIIVAFIAVLLGALFAITQLPWGLGGIWLIIVSLLFFLALLGGLVMALTALGVLGGGHLMYPTIAVEGSDSFDAVSRSFSYLYARPWQLIWYTLVALVYGAITYLFVRFFLYVLLGLTHMAIGMFMYGEAHDGTSLMSSIWPWNRNWMALSYEPNYEGMGTLYDIGSFLLAFWVYLTISILGAYAISLYFSSSTIIYYLMRREVDATAIDEVYLEPTDDDFVDATSPEITPTTVTPADQATTTNPTGTGVTTAGATAATAATAPTAADTAPPATEQPAPPPTSDAADPQLGHPVDQPTEPGTNQPIDQARPADLSTPGTEPDVDNPNPEVPPKDQQTPNP